MLVDYLLYAIFGLLFGLALIWMFVFNVRRERARREAEAKMTPEQREAARKEREAYRRMGSG